MIYDYECQSCLRVHEEFHSAFERPTVLCECGGKCIKLIATGAMFCGVNGRNNMYDFVDYKTRPYPVKINGRRQWREHLKSLGMHDDVKNDPLTKSDIETIQQNAKKKKFDNHKEIKNRVTDIVRNIPSSKLKERAKQVIKRGGG